MNAPSIYSIFLADSLRDPDHSSASERIGVREQKVGDRSRYFYPVFVWLVGEHVNLVERVRYRMHASSIPHDVVVGRTEVNRECKYRFLLSGAFEAIAEVTLITGQVITVRHYLTFVNEIHDPRNRFTVNAA